MIQKPFSFPVAMLAWLAAFSLSVCGCETPPPAKYAVQHPTLSLAEFQSWVKAGKVPVLDARDEQSYRAGHIPGALLLSPGGNFLNNFQRLERILARHKNALVIVYCDSLWCERADELQMQLIAQGFQHVARFPGGWTEWQQAKLPIEMPHR